MVKGDQLYGDRKNNYGVTQFLWAQINKSSEWENINEGNILAIGWMESYLLHTAIVQYHTEKFTPFSN